MSRWIVAGVLLFTAVIRFGWVYIRSPNVYSEQIVKISTKVNSLPVERWGSEWLEIDLGKEKVNVKIPESKVVQYADKLEVVGTLEDRVIGGKRVGYNLIIRDFNLVSGSKGPVYGLFRLRQAMNGRLLKWLPGDEGALAAGMLLGGSEGMSDKGKVNFRINGLTHVVAASGYNVSVVTGWIMAMGIMVMKRRKALILGIAGTVIYIIIAGMETAVIRAGIMAVLAQTALIFGRKTEAGWLLLVSALSMLIYNPWWIRDIGFQLSVAATAGLIVSGGNTWGWAEGLKTTLAAYIFTMPIILHYFGNLSVVAPLTNFVVLWVVPVIMQISAAALLIGWIVPMAGQLLAWGAWPFLKWMTWMVSLAAEWKWSSVSVGTMSWVWVGGYYLVLLLLNLQTTKNSARALLASMWMTARCFLGFSKP